MIGILIMTGLIAGCWKVSKNLQKELKEEMETIGEAEKSDRIVVLDAGHGGTDSGKVGINGVKEKDINLTISNSVKKIMEIENILVKKYAGTVVKRFLKKLELYHSVLFRENLKSPFFYEKYFTTLTLNVIHTCNMRGKYCFEEIEFRKDTEIMNEEIAIKAIDIFYNQLN